jgi:hypothetical protein
MIYERGLKYFQGTELKVLLFLCREANNTTHIPPPASSTLTKISTETGVSLGTISGIIKSLTMQGAICLDKDGRNNIYHIQFTPPEWWPQHGPVNAARIRAAGDRREILKSNYSIYRAKGRADNSIPRVEPFKAPGSGGDDSGLGEPSGEEGIHGEETRLPAF